LKKKKKPDKSIHSVFFDWKKEIINPLKTIESPLFDGNILFKVDSVTGELVIMTLTYTNTS